MSSSRSERFFASAPRGLEELLSREITSLGGKDISVVPGGVSYEGDWSACYRVNFWSRIASRVLWRVGDFDYRSEHDVYAATKALDWLAHFKVERTLRVNVTAQKSPLKSLEFVTLRIKDAVCDRFREKTGRRPSVDRARPDVRVHAFLDGTHATLYLDTSGEPLFKRGWRHGVADAPLRENLAAGIIQLTGWQPDEPLLDPMCGGGTLLVEAAAMARGRAPGAKRAFGFEKLSTFDAQAWSKVKSEQREKHAELRLFGSDTDPKALNAARRNLAEAGIERWVQLERSDILERGAPAPRGVMVANPPYGERLGSADELAAFYPRLGDALKKNFAGWRCYFFTADLRLPKLIRLQPSRRTPLFNGALECRLYEFVIVSGSHRG
ncbi:MAG: class I SAM-dependent RNA methyltransferase [Betaproteobacteria bacterium]|nr:MAG: class I SAM-dependent RNA methyltransferase [Betaproteobacteria bacterium]